MLSLIVLSFFCVLPPLFSSSEIGRECLLTAVEIGWDPVLSRLVLLIIIYGDEESFISLFTSLIVIYD
jgi:hypothetical protein